jgi:hypothetical protein
MLNDSDPKRVKGVLPAMIDGIRVDARDQIEPTFRVPAVRIESGYMGETWLCANHVMLVGPPVGADQAKTSQAQPATRFDIERGERRAVKAALIVT